MPPDLGTEDLICSAPSHLHQTLLEYLCRRPLLYQTFIKYLVPASFHPSDVPEYLVPASFLQAV
ncbi:hypothetical protein FH972_002772 [Carpinus fangiana]|uniref:Uncharacterized protein n=1 Tax=Carpinus fangiana TaxID=176857 RepID=A0A5N6QFW5_9ROSI|nr:hypothetical protein FH972_002772 [Carpinus fangiana]